MPMGSFFKKLFKKSATAATEKYAGEDAAKMVTKGLEKLEGEVGGASSGAFEDPLVDGLMQVFTGQQQSGLTSVFSALSGDGSGFKELAASKGLDPTLISALMSLLSGGASGGEGGASGGMGGALSAVGGGGGGFNFGSLLSVAKALTSKTGGGGGFLSLLTSLGDGNSSNTVLQTLFGLAKSFFKIQGDKNPAMKDWSKAGGDKDEKDNDSSIGDFGDHLIKDLIFPGKKDKDILDEDTKGKKTDENDIKGWFDKHPEIGKMQKQVFDDVFDLGDDSSSSADDDDAPLIPTPIGFKEDCSILHSGSILFLNTNILLELRKSWRFLYSSRVHEADYSDFMKRICYQGPTLMIIKDEENHVFGVFSSTSWGVTDGGFSGNGDTFIFSIKEKMAIYYATGKNENFLYMSSNDGLGVGGTSSHFGLKIDSSLTSGTYNEDIITFDLPKHVVPSSFTINHLEVWGLGPEVDSSREKSNLNVRKPNLKITSRSVDMDDLMDQIS